MFLLCAVIFFARHVNKHKKRAVPPASPSGVYTGGTGEFAKAEMSAAWLVEMQHDDLQYQHRVVAVEMQHDNSQYQHYVTPVEMQQPSSELPAGDVHRGYGT